MSSVSAQVNTDDLLRLSDQRDRLDQLDLQDSLGKAQRCTNVHDFPLFRGFLAERTRAGALNARQGRPGCGRSTSGRRTAASAGRRARLAPLAPTPSVTVSTPSVAQAPPPAEVQRT